MNTTIRPATLVVVLTTLVACVSGQRLPRDTVAVVTPLTLGPPPIYALIGFRDELDLTSEQISALDDIAQGFEEETQPLVEELMTEPGQGGQVVVRPDGEETLTQIRDNQRKAGEAVEALLNEEQRATVCRLYERPDDRRSGNTPPRRAVRRDTATDNRLLRPVGWEWCSNEGEEQAGG